MGELFDCLLKCPYRLPDEIPNGLPNASGLPNMGLLTLRNTLSNGTNRWAITTGGGWVESGAGDISPGKIRPGLGFRLGDFQSPGPAIQLYPGDSPVPTKKIAGLQLPRHTQRTIFFGNFWFPNAPFPDR